MRTLKNHLSYVVHKAQGVPKRCDYAGVVAICACEHECATVTLY
jgi:hypothetical protein